jgi:hypothetical protein
LVELIASALKNKQPVAKLLEVSQKFLVDRKCVWRKEPLFLREEAFFWESGTDRLQTVVGNGDHFTETSNVQPPSANAAEAGAERPTPNFVGRLCETPFW